MRTSHQPVKLADRAMPWVAVIAGTAWYALAMLADKAHPTTAFLGWWGWWDQSLYLRAAQAWSAGVLDPAEHWYFPGYPLLAAPFVRLLPTDPFIPVDLACLWISTLAFCALAARLLDRPGARAIGAAVWMVTVVASPLGFRIWVEPWTTTPVAALGLVSLWLSLRLLDGGGIRIAAWLGLSVAAIVLFRPTDAVVLGASAALTTGFVTITRRDWRVMAAWALGAGVSVGVFAATYLAIYGLRRSPYLEISAAMGFEWRLLPLRWVTLVVDPTPLLPDEAGLARAFWWVVPGVLGAAACLASTRGGTWRRHAAVLLTVTVHCALYLAYRDLHPQGLIRFGNYHYFRWVLPILGLYAVALVLVPVWSGRQRLGWGAAGLALGLFCWRAQFVPGPAPARWTGPADLLLPDGFDGITGAVRIAAKGDFVALYQTYFALTAGGMAWNQYSAFKTEPVPGGLLLVPLRPLPPGPVSIAFPAVMAVDASVPPEMGRQAIVFDPPWAWRGPARLWRRLYGGVRTR